MKKIFLILGISLGMIAFNSCEKLDDLDSLGDPKVDKTATYPMNGEWWVTYKLDDGTGNLVDAGVVWGIGEIGHLKLLTFNTTENVSNKLWITDCEDLAYTGEGNFWSYRGIVDLDLKNKAFSATGAQNVAYFDGSPYDITMNVGNGKVLMGKGISLDGNATDSIYFELEFSDSPGDIFVVSGHRRTGFLEDDFY